MEDSSCGAKDLRECVLLRPRVEVLHRRSCNPQLLCGGCEADGVRAREDDAGLDGVGAGGGGAGAVHADCNTATISVKTQPSDLELLVVANSESSSTQVLSWF